MSDACGKLQFRITSAFAEFECEIISERTEAGLDRAREENKHQGGSKEGMDITKGGYYLRYIKI